MKIYLQKNTSGVITKTALIAKKLNDCGVSRILIFSEDKITLSLELELAKVFDGGFMNVEVSTFKRYVSSKNQTAKMLSKESSCMAIRKIMSENASSDGESALYNFKSASSGTALVLYELISQISSANVQIDDLKNLIEQDKENMSPALLNKLQGVIFVFEKYKEFTKNNGVYDSSDYLGLMPEILKKDGELKDTFVILSGFSSMTKQRVQIIEEISRHAKGVVAVALGKKNSDVYTNETADKLKSLEPNSSLIYESEDATCENDLILEYLYNPCVFKKDFAFFKTDKISILEAHNLGEETEEIARSIVSQVKSGKKFSEISVAFGDLNSYLPYVIKYFSEYEIPYYVDKATTLDAHPVCDFIVNYLNLVKRNFAKEDFINFVRSPMFNVNFNLIDELVCYVNQYALTRKALKTPFTALHENLKEFEQLRKCAFEAFCYGEKAKTIGDFVDAIKNTIERVGVLENVEKCGRLLLNYGERARSEYNEKVGEKVISLLDSANVIGKEIPVKVNDFINVFLSGAKAVEISKIPLFKDAVCVGECKDVKIKSVKILYFAGLNGDVPFTKGDTALLTDGDLKELKGFKILVEPTISAVNKRERESVAVAMSSFSEKLILSYSDMSARGEATFKSEVISSISKIFGVKTNRPKELTSVRDGESLNYENLGYLFSAKTPAYKNLALLLEPFKKKDDCASTIINTFNVFSKEIEEKGKENRLNGLIESEKKQKHLENAKDLYFLDGYVSSTAIEKYFSCPYAGFVQNVLKLQEVKDGQMKVYETGTLLHELTEKYVKNISKVADERSSDELVEELFNEIWQAEEYKYYLESARYKHSFEDLKKEGKRVCFAIFNSYQNSDFSPYLLEVAFDDDKHFKAIKLNAKSGQYKIRGKVDRIDKFQDKIRVVDYKTGRIDAHDEKFYVGTKLQLFLYLNAFVKDGLSPAGAYYFPVKDGFNESESANYKMQGSTINDHEVFVASDNNIVQNRSSEYIPVKLNKDGSADSHSHALESDEFDKYLKYAVKVSENGVDEMVSGYISPTPYKGSCEYCKYGALCGFSVENGDKERCVKKINKETIINAVDYQENLENCKEKENE